MNINKHLENVPSWVFYIVVFSMFVFLTFFIAFYPKGFLFSSGKSIDNTLTIVTESFLNIDYKDYLIFEIPLGLLFIFFCINFGGRIIDHANLVKIKGDRYLSILVILAGIPIVFIMSFFILTDILLLKYFRNLLAIGSVFVLLYLIFNKSS